MKKSLLGAVALVGALAAGIAACGTQVGGTAARSVTQTKDGESTSTSSPATAPATKPTITTTTTVKPKPVDPLAGIVALEIHGRNVFGIDARGREVRTLVTAYAGRAVTSAHMMSDHHTIWYVTQPDTQTDPNPAYACDDVVRLDLAHNHRTVIAHARDFSVSSDGSRVLLRSVEADTACPGPGTNREDVVLDVATGAHSVVVTPKDTYFPNLELSPGGHVVVGTRCMSDNEYVDECHIPLQSASIPDQLGAAVTLRPINDQTLSFLDLVPRSDGLYALVDTHAQNCGCGGHGDRTDRDITIRRLSWSDLGASGDKVFTVQGPFWLLGFSVGPNGQLVGLGQTKEANPFGVFALNGDAAHQLRSWGESIYQLQYHSVGSIAPWDGGR